MRTPYWVALAACAVTGVVYATAPDTVHKEDAVTAVGDDAAAALLSGADEHGWRSVRQYRDHSRGARVTVLEHAGTGHRIRVYENAAVSHTGRQTPVTGLPGLAGLDHRDYDVADPDGLAAPSAAMGQAGVEGPQWPPAPVPHAAPADGTEPSFRLGPLAIGTAGGGCVRQVSASPDPLLALLGLIAAAGVCLRYGD